MTVTRPPSARWNPDALAALEHQRNTLLRDLRELDEQHATADIDTGRYEALRDELTARAADVLTALDRNRTTRPTRPRQTRTTAMIVVAVALTAIAAGWLLTSQLAPRVAPAPPQAATADGGERIARLAAVVQREPDDVPARLALARLLLQEQDLPAALEQFDAVTDRDPAHAEALTYGGWVAVLTGDTAGGLKRLDRAVAADETYPDAHALRGLALMRSGDDAAAVTELRRYLDLAPSGPLADQVGAVIARLEGAS